MGGRIRQNIPEDRYNAVERAVRDYCVEMAQGTQSNYVKPKRIRKSITFPDGLADEEHFRGWLVGSVLTDAEYAEKWGGDTYRIEPDQL